MFRRGAIRKKTESRFSGKIFKEKNNSEYNRPQQKAL
jgi:hypothetical protein